MPKLKEQDWKKLKVEKIAFLHMPQKLFELLLKKVCASANPDEDQLDDTDKLMIYLARLEPPIQPQI